MEYAENIKLRKARRRVEALKGFYKHLLIYIIVKVAAKVFQYKSKTLKNWEEKQIRKFLKEE